MSQFSCALSSASPTNKGTNHSCKPVFNDCVGGRYDSVPPNRQAQNQLAAAEMFCNLSLDCTNSQWTFMRLYWTASVNSVTQHFEDLQLFPKQQFHFNICSIKKLLVYIMQAIVSHYLQHVYVVKTGEEPILSINFNGKLTFYLHAFSPA